MTNDILALSGGHSVYAAWLTPQGRMITDLRLYRASDYLLASVPAALAGALRDRFDQLIFAEDVRVTDVTASIAHVTLIGPGAEDMAVSISGDIVAHTDELDLPTVDVFTSADGALGLQARGASQSAVVSADLFDAMRIDAGRPAFGADMTEETIPLEAGLLDRAISTTKGCYVGQEVIIRVLHRGGGRVVKRLVKLEFERAVEAGAALHSDGREVGSVTSAATSPRSGRAIGLGYVHRDQASVGAALTADGIRAEVVALAG